MKNYIFLLFMVIIPWGKLTAQNRNERLIGAFYQGQVRISDTYKTCGNVTREGNCAAIALSKLMIGQFGGVAAAFREFGHHGNDYSVTLPNGTRLEFTQANLDTAKARSGIKKNGDIYYDSAMIVFACICQRVCQLGDKLKPGCINSFDDAVDYIDCGFNAGDVDTLLGFTKRKITLRELKSEPAAIIYDGHHASFCTRGIQDFLGNPHRIKWRWMYNPVGWGFFISHAYKLAR